MAEEVIDKPVVEQELPGAMTFAELFKDATPDEPEEAEIKEPAAEAETKPAATEAKKEDAKPADKTEDKATEEVKEAAVKFNINKPAAAEETTKPAVESNTSDNKPVAEAKPAAAAKSRVEQLKELGLDDWDIEFAAYRKSGGDPLKYIDAKGRDWDKVSDLDLVKAKLRAENSFLDGEDLDVMIEEGLSKYRIDPDASEADKKRASVLLKVEGHKLREAAKQEQAKFQIPEIKPADTNKEQGPTAQEVYAKELKTNPETLALLKNKKVVADGGKDGYKVSFDIDEPEELVNLWTDAPTYAKHMLDASGKPNVAKQNLMSLVAINPQLVFATLIDHGRELEKQANVTNKQNISKKETVIPSENGKKSLSQAFGSEGKDMKMSDLG